MGGVEGWVVRGWGVGAGSEWGRVYDTKGRGGRVRVGWWAGGKKKRER